METGALSLTINRWSPFVYTIDFPGFDFSDASFSAQFRNYRDAPGDPLIDLANASAGAEGISVSVTADDGVPTSELTIQIDEATISALRFTNPRGGDVILQWALHIDDPTIGKIRWVEGDCIIKAGAAQ